jgi:hypothetical protein
MMIKMMNTKNIRNLLGAIIIIGAFGFFAGCSETLEPDDTPLSVDNGSGEVNGDGGEGEESGLIKVPKLMLYNMPGGIFDLEEGTFVTPETFGRLPVESDDGVDPSLLDEDSRKRGKFLIEGAHLVSTSKLDSGGFTDVQFIHYKDALEREFTLRARVLMTAKAADTTSKGFFFGAFTGTPKYKRGSEDELDYVEFTSRDTGAGLLFRTNDTADSNSSGAAIRPYFHNGRTGWSTGPTKTSQTGTARPEYWLNARQPTYKQERILEVVRQEETRVATDSTSRKVAFIFRIYDSKTGRLLNEAFLDTDEVNEALWKGQPVYVGIALLGSSVEFSQVSVWDNKDKSGEPIFKTPETEPAYVAVESVQIGYWRHSDSGDTFNTRYPLSNLLPNCGKVSISSVADAVNRPITLEAVYTPSYADNLFVDWKIIIDNSEKKIKLDFDETDGSADTGWKKAKVTVEGSGSVVIMAVSRDSGLADHCLELVVN